MTFFPLFLGVQSAPEVGRTSYKKHPVCRVDAGPNRGSNDLVELATVFKTFRKFGKTSEKRKKRQSPFSATLGVTSSARNETSG